MVSILPAERSSWDVIGNQVGKNLQQVLPGAIQQGYNRQLGLNALDQAQQEIAKAGGDPYKMALAFARLGIASPENSNLQRAMGPLLETALAGSKVNRAFPQDQGGAAPQPGQVPTQGMPGQPAGSPQSMGSPPQPNPAPYEGAPQGQPSAFATPSPFNIMTPQDIQAESERYARALQDPNAAAMRQTQLQNQNTIATQQREALEDMALKSDVSASELPRFMQVGAKFDPRNPSEWMQNTKRAYSSVKSNDDKIKKTFIPGIGSALFGKDREKALENLVQTSQDQKALGLEQETRNYYADNYMSPTEIERQFYPLTAEKESAISKIPRGVFPKEKEPAYKARPFISYEEALERAPKELQRMQNTLSDFFVKNVDPDTSLLVLRDKLWTERDYDWRQIGPAIREAQKNGLKLNQRQSTELADIETQPPLQSLPDIFKDLWRIPAYIRGNK